MNAGAGRVTLVSSWNSVGSDWIRIQWGPKSDHHPIIPCKVKYWSNSSFCCRKLARWTFPKFCSNFAASLPSELSQTLPVNDTNLTNLSIVSYYPVVSTESSPLSFGVQKPGQQVRPVNVHRSRSQDAANYRAVICSPRTTRTAQLLHEGDVTISRFEAICFHKLTLSLIMKSFNLPRIWLEWAWCGWWKMVQRRSSNEDRPVKKVQRRWLNEEVQKDLNGKWSNEDV